MFPDFLQLRFDHADDPRVLQLGHLAGAAEEPLAACAVFRVQAVEDFDRHQHLSFFIPRLPDGGETAAAEDLDELEAILAEPVARLQALTVPQGALQGEDLFSDVRDVSAGDG